MYMTTRRTIQLTSVTQSERINYYYPRILSHCAFCFYTAIHIFHSCFLFCLTRVGLQGSTQPSTPIFNSLSLLWSSITHLMKLLQENLSEVKGGEANPHCNRSFNPVHTETFVESADNPFLGHNLPHGAQDGAVRVTCDTRSLHPPPYYIQRVRRRLADETCTGSKSQAFVWVGLLAAAVLCMEEKGVRFKYCTWTAAVHRRKGTGLDQYTDKHVAVEYLHATSSVSHR